MKRKVKSQKSKAIRQKFSGFSLRKILLFLTFDFCLLTFAFPLHASSGTEGGSFLEIPVGAGPAAMGAAYTALANDAYAATYNPAGLGFLNSTQFAGQHLSYIDTIHYEYLSFAVPMYHPSSNQAERPTSSLGGSVQYLGTGYVPGMDQLGNPTGSISGSYASYNLAYGHSFSDKLSLGLTGKMINATLANVSANAYAADLGGMYKLQPNLNLGATLTNLGTKLTFLNEGDDLPLAFHLGAAYQPNAHWLITTEGIYPKTGLASFNVGGEWRPIEMLALRTGYRTDTTQGLSVLAGFFSRFRAKSLGAGTGLCLAAVRGPGQHTIYLPFNEVRRSGKGETQFDPVPAHQAAPDGEQLL